jgi:hypothetical protein
VEVVQQWLGPHDIRRIEREATWYIAPAPELAAVPAVDPNGEVLAVNTLSDGRLSASFIFVTLRRRLAPARIGRLRFEISQSTLQVD